MFCDSDCYSLLGMTGISVPNVSFSEYKLNFFQRFVESHLVMFNGNAGLKPKEGEMTSKPWMWPINLRVILINIVSSRSL